MSPNRLVAVLTPILAPVAGVVAAWLANEFPGLNLSEDQLTAVFITCALIVFGKSAQWMYGWQKYEAREAAREDASEGLRAREAAIAAREAEFTPLDAADATVADAELFDEDADIDPDFDPDLDDTTVVAADAGR